MGYMEMIREITAADRRQHFGQPSALSAPMFVVMLGLSKEVKELLINELNERWSAARKYVRVLDIDTNVAGASLKETDEYKIVRRFRIGLPGRIDEQVECAQFAWYAYNVVGNAVKELNGLGDKCSIHVVCGMEMEEALLAEKCGLVLQYYISMLGGQADVRTLFGYIPEKLPIFHSAVLEWAERMQNWMKQATDEKIAPSFEKNKDGQWIPNPQKLLPCNIFLAGNACTFTRVVVLDRLDSNGVPYSEWDLIHTTALLMDPDSGITWPAPKNDTPCELYSAYLYPRYADQHELDLALALRIWQNAIDGRVHQADAAAPDMTPINNTLVYDCLIKRIRDSLSEIRGFRPGDITCFANRDVTTSDVENSEFGKAIEAHMEHIWIQALIALRDEQLDGWRNAVRAKIEEVYAINALKDSKEMWPDLEEAQKSLHRKNGTQQRVEKIRKEAEIKQARDRMNYFAANGCFANYDADRIESVILGGEALKKDPIVNAVLQYGINEEIDEIARERVAELEQILSQKKDVDGEISTVIDVFRGEVENVCPTFDMKARCGEVEGELTEELSTAYMSSLSADHEEQLARVRNVLERTYEHFKAQNFNPILCNVPEVTNRIACRVAMGVTPGSFEQVPAGVDGGLHLHIATLNVAMVQAFNPNVLGG